MDEKKYKDDLSDLRRTIRRQRLNNVALVIALVFSSGGLFQIIGKEKTIISPPSVTKTFWVSADKVSASYLEQMAGYVTSLILDISPGSAKWKTDSLLAFVVPEEQGKLRIQQRVEVDRLRKLNGATYFETHEMRPSEETQSVLIVGRLKTMVNDKLVGAENKTFLAKFSYAGGRTQLKSFGEVENEKSRQARSRRAVDGRS